MRLKAEVFVTGQKQTSPLRFIGEGEGDAMPVFYFNLQYTDAPQREDEEGTELPNEAAAREEAQRSLREIIGNAIRAGRTDVPECIAVFDAKGRSVCSIYARETLPAALVNT